MKDLFQQNPEEEIARLRTELALYQQQYYVDAKPTVSDLTYDRLMDRLIELEQENPHLRTPDSPSQRVGSDLNMDFPEVPPYHFRCLAWIKRIVAKPCCSGCSGLRRRVAAPWHS